LLNLKGQQFAVFFQERKLKTKIVLPFLENGIYFLKIKDNKQIRIVKFLKE